MKMDIIATYMAFVISIIALFISVITLVSFNSNKKERRLFKFWNTIIYVLVIILLLILIIISLTGKNGDVTSENSAFSFILTGLGIFVATSVFLPKFIMKQIIDDKIEEAKEQLKKDGNQYEIEVLKTEAHDNRMNAYFLIKHEDYLWALGWGIKSFKQYLKLMNRNDYNLNYNDLINDELGDKIFKRLKDVLNKPLKDIDKNKIERLLKDYYDALIDYEELKKNNPTLIHNFIDTKDLIKDCFDAIKKYNMDIFEGIKLDSILSRTSNINEKFNEYFKNQFGITK